MTTVNLLKLDIDKPYNSKNIHRVLMRVFEVTQLVFARGTEVTAIFAPSQHKNIHAWVLIKGKTALTPLEITCLQAIMGSDWRREAFNFVRAYHYKNIEDWQRWSNVLFISRTPLKPKAMTRLVARLSGRAPGSRIEGGEI